MNIIFLQIKIHSWWSYVRNRKKKALFHGINFLLTSVATIPNLIYPKVLMEQTLFSMKTEKLQKANRAVYSCA